MGSLCLERSGEPFGVDLGRLLGLLEWEGPAKTGSPDCRIEYCDFNVGAGFRGDSNLAALAAIELDGTCRKTSFSTAPMLEDAE